MVCSSFGVAGSCNSFFFPDDWDISPGGPQISLMPVILLDCCGHLAFLTPPGLGKTLFFGRRSLFCFALPTRPTFPGPDRSHGKA